MYNKSDYLWDVDATC